MHRHLLTMLRDRAFVSYAVIGASGVLLDFLIYFGLVKVGIPPFISSMISVSAGIANNFIWNARYTFKKSDHLLARFGSFYMVGFTGVLLSALIILLLHNIIGVNDVLAKLASVPVIVMLQFWLNKNVSFVDNRQQIPWKTIMLIVICFAVPCIMAVNAPYFNFTDENDNLLGAQLIAEEHAVIYKDYFSHHMPLMYFVAAPLLVFFGTNLIAVKVVFGLLMSFWLLMMCRHVLRAYGIKLFASLTLLIALSQMLSWSHMILAETFVALCLLHAVILFMTRPSRNPNIYGEIATYSALGAMPALAALPYAPVSLLIYGLLGVSLIRFRQLKLRSFLFSAIMVALPFLVLLGYFYATRSFGEFREQAITFNTLYYSQFAGDAPGSPLEAALAIPAGTFGSLQTALTAPTAPGQPLIFLFAISIIVALYLLVRLKQFSVAIVFGLAMVLGASRGGLGAAFTNSNVARAGTVISVVGLFLITYALYTLWSKKRSATTTPPFGNSLSLLLVSFLGLLVISSAALVSKTAVEYSQGKSTVLTVEEPGSPSTVINIVNAPEDKYWIGPVDFSSQLIVNSENVSSYRFYAPWHSVCEKCTAQLVSDIKDKDPNVVALDASMRVWGKPVKVYAKELLTVLDDEYYQLDDVRLKQFYFRLDNRDVINKRLSEAGYDL